LKAVGHRVKIVSPQYVKSFVRRQKNDANESEAISTAARQPHIPLVPRKTIEQQDIQTNSRQRLARPSGNSITSSGISTAESCGK